jgi:hypothetical protein
VTLTQPSASVLMLTRGHRGENKAAIEVAKRQGVNMEGGKYEIYGLDEECVLARRSPSMCLVLTPCQGDMGAHPGYGRVVEGHHMDAAADERAPGCMTSRVFLLYFIRALRVSVGTPHRLQAPAPIPVTTPSDRPRASLVS